MLWRYPICDVILKGLGSSFCDMDSSGHLVIGTNARTRLWNQVFVTFETKLDPWKKHSWT
jgi:hypothetical protein